MVRARARGGGGFGVKRDEDKGLEDWYTPVPKMAILKFQAAWQQLVGEG